MRLIDAGALASVLEEWEEKACDCTENDGSDGTTRVLHPVPTTTREMIDLIADQPTIETEPVRHGRWVKIYGRSKCSECKGTAHFGFTGVQVLSNYCPNCGAKMDGGNDHD